MRLPTASLGGWTPDARTLITEGIGSGSDLYAFSPTEKSPPRVYVQTEFNEQHSWLSPDGRWVAYMSNQSGRSEVYVQAFPGPSGRSQVSTDGGTEPVWARSGRELFYRNGNKMMAVIIETGSTFRASAPRVLFEGEYARVDWAEANYDVSPGGQRFLMLRSEAQPPATELHLVVNWFAELPRGGSRYVFRLPRGDPA